MLEISPKPDLKRFYLYTEITPWFYQVYILHTIPSWKAPQGHENYHKKSDRTPVSPFPVASLTCWPSEHVAITSHVSIAWIFTCLFYTSTTISGLIPLNSVAKVKYVHKWLPLFKGSLSVCVPVCTHLHLGTHAYMYAYPWRSVFHIQCIPQ